MQRNTMNDFAESVPTQVDLTAELYALRRFENGEPIGADMEITDLLAQIVGKGMPRLEVIKRLHQRYRIEDVPILHEREVCDAMDIDNRLNNDFFSNIVDEKAGYFSGNPMTFTFDEKDTVAAERFDHFKVRTRLDDINYETTKNCAIGGYDARLVYIRHDFFGYDGSKPVFKPMEAVKQIPAYEVIFLGEAGYDEPEYAVRTFTYDDLEGTTIYRVELYMPFKAYIFEGEALEELEPLDNEINAENVGDEEGREIGVINYPFTRCPLYGYENNAELMGDAERVLHLIDAYDRVMSDTDSELEAFRGAYLAFFGVEPPDEDDDEFFNAKAMGTLYFRNDKENKQDGRFITKDLPVAAKEAHVERLEDNIYRFSKTPNLSEKKTGMSVSGEALRQRMIPMENKTASFERKFVSGNLRMLECISDVYRMENIVLDPYSVTQSFKRKLPENLEYEAKLIELFKGNLPMERIYAMLSFVDNPQELALWYEKHKDDQEQMTYYGATPPVPIGGASDVKKDGAVEDGTVDNTNTDVVDK